MIAALAFGALAQPRPGPCHPRARGCPRPLSPALLHCHKSYYSNLYSTVPRQHPPLHRNETMRENRHIRDARGSMADFDKPADSILARSTIGLQV
jgi:hypothetical protein